MNFCTKCGIQLKSDASFCSNCGEKVMPVVQSPESIPPVIPTICSCGAPINPGVKFCTTCGVTVSKTTAAQPVTKPQNTAAPITPAGAAPPVRDTPPEAPKKKKRRLSRFWTFVLIVLLGTIGYYVVQNWPKKTAVEKEYNQVPDYFQN